jgi:hypothetical protein
MDSNDPTKPEVWIYSDNGEVDFVLSDDATTIKSKDETGINLHNCWTELLLVEKLSDGCYKKNTDLIRLQFTAIRTENFR